MPGNTPRRRAQSCTVLGDPAAAWSRSSRWLEVAERVAYSRRRDLFAQTAVAPAAEARAARGQAGADSLRRCLSVRFRPREGAGRCARAFPARRPRSSSPRSALSATDRKASANPTEVRLRRGRNPRPCSVRDRERREALRQQPEEFSTAGWMVAVSYPGTKWKKVPCQGWC